MTKNECDLLEGTLISLAELPLEVVPQLLHRLQPGAVLRQVEHGEALLLCQILGMLPAMGTSVVEQYEDALVLGAMGTTKGVHGAVQEVLEDDGIRATLHNLHGHHPIHCHGCRHRKSVGGASLCALKLSSHLHHLLWQAVRIRKLWLRTVTAIVGEGMRAGEFRSVTGLMLSRFIA